MIDGILEKLQRGYTSFLQDRVTVDIKAGSDSRYYALIRTPTYNTMVNTPLTVHSEGILSFYERLATALADIIKEFENG